jgi:hypothetical protein
MKMDDNENGRIILDHTRQIPVTCHGNKSEKSKLFYQVIPLAVYTNLIFETSA